METALFAHKMQYSTFQPLQGDVPIYNEQIVLSKHGRGKDQDQAQVILQTTTTLTHTSHEDDINHKPRSVGDEIEGTNPPYHYQISLLHPVDSILVSLMEKYGLQSLSLSVSSSSMTKYEHGKNFPVGTAVQFTRMRTHTDEDSDTGKEIHKKKGKGSYAKRTETKNENEIQIEYELMRILSSKNLFCENVQLEQFYNGNMNAIEIQVHDSLGQHQEKELEQKKSSRSHNNAISKIIMLPNDAFSLCHTRALWDKIVSSAPCRDRAGIYSHLQWDLNGMDIVDKAAWIHLERRKDAFHNNRQEEEYGNDTATDGISVSSDDGPSRNVIEIEKGLGFTRWMPMVGSGQGRGRDSDLPTHGVTLSKVLSGKNYKDSTLAHCPLTESSTMVVNDANGHTVLHNLDGDDFDMNASIDVGSPNGNEKTSSSISSKMGVERHVVRLNGVANGGMLQTRAYYPNQSEKCANDTVQVNLVDVFPNFISPVYHTMRILLVEGNGAGSEFCGFDPSAIARTTVMQQMHRSRNESYSITQFPLGDLDHKLALSPGGLSTLSISMNIPKDASLYIQVDYNPRFLSFEQFPADPNRGFDVPPSIATFSCPLRATSLAQSQIPIPGQPHTHQEFYTQTYSNALLIMPPVPDLSMPFNVISITSTFFALILGTLINVLIHKSREYIKEKFNGNENPKSKVGKLKDKVKAKIDRLRLRFVKKKIE